MNRDDVIRMAREADLVTWGFESLDWEPVANMEAIERFAALVAAAEREACANVCESLFDMDDDSCDEAEQCAAAIRARGETK